MAFVGDVPPCHHGSSKGDPFHGEGLGVGELSGCPQVVELIDNVVRVVFHGNLDEAGSHVLFRNEGGD